jgi:hypothetical protein
LLAHERLNAQVQLIADSQTNAGGSSHPEEQVACGED